MEQTPRFHLPLLITGQGQKDITHNEALLLLDAAVGSVAESRAVAEPPSEAQEGQCWLIPLGAGLEWQGHGNELAMWTAGGWRFLDLPEGSALFIKAEQRRYRRLADGWQIDWPFGGSVSAIPLPQGGSVVDAEAREAVNSLILHLQGLGLIAD